MNLNYLFNFNDNYEEAYYLKKIRIKKNKLKNSSLKNKKKLNFYIMITVEIKLDSNIYLMS